MTDRSARLSDTVISVQVDLAIFHASPEPLDKNMVPLGAIAVRADLDFVDAHKGGNIGTGELRHRFSWSRQSCRVQAENPPIPGVQLSRASFVSNDEGTQETGA
jgi:hypothetical protein